MQRRALITQIDQYDNFPALGSCVADAAAIAEALKKHASGSPNFSCKLVTSADERLTRESMRAEWRELFAAFTGDTLFYFSGHGVSMDNGGYLVTQDGTVGEPGVHMNDLVSLANRSTAKTVLLILDCCVSGNIGNLPSLGRDQSLLREGVTILAASRANQVAMEIGGHGVFTGLVLGALYGGAADVRGRVSAAAIYAYAEAALGPWEQRPLYKSHAAQLDPVRFCEPKVSDEGIRRLNELFPLQGDRFSINMTYEETSPSALPENVAIFKELKRLQIAGLLKPSEGNDLYWTAHVSGTVILTELGKFYHLLVQQERI